MECNLNRSDSIIISPERLQKLFFWPNLIYLNRLILWTESRIAHNPYLWLPPANVKKEYSEKLLKTGRNCKTRIERKEEIHKALNKLKNSSRFSTTRTIQFLFCLCFLDRQTKTNPKLKSWFWSQGLIMKIALKTKNISWLNNQGKILLLIHSMLDGNTQNL